MWINLFNTEIQSFFGGKKYVAFYSSQQTSFSSTSIIPVSGLTSQASYLSHYFFPGKEKKQVHRYSLLFAMTAGSIFVPAGNPHPLQPECFSPECQASTYWWTWDRTASEAASKMHILGNRMLLCFNDLSKQHCARGHTDCKHRGPEGQENKKTQTLSLSPRGAPVPSLPQLRWTAVAPYILSLPLFHMQACLLNSFSFPLHDGFISGVYVCPGQGWPAVATSLVQENHFPHWNF